MVRGLIHRGPGLNIVHHVHKTNTSHRMAPTPAVHLATNQVSNPEFRRCARFRTSSHI